MPAVVSGGEVVLLGLLAMPPRLPALAAAVGPGACGRRVLAVAVAALLPNLQVAPSLPPCTQAVEAHVRLLEWSGHCTPIKAESGDVDAPAGATRSGLQKDKNRAEL